MRDQLSLALDLSCRPLAAPPPGAAPLGPPELCSGCGALAMPFAIVVHDPFCNDVFADPDRRDPLCVVCTEAEVKKRVALGRRVPSFLAWAGGGHA